jgi:hypothetical protein
VAFKFMLEYDGTLSLEAAVFQALGASSMCWSEMPVGVFDDRMAKEIGDALIELVKEGNFQ